MGFEPKSATLVEGHCSWAQFAPHASLAPWISSYWTLDADGPHAIRTLPDACVDLTIRLLAVPRAFVVPAEGKARRQTTTQAEHLLGARLLPGAAARLGIDVGALGRGWTPLEEVLPRKVVARLVRGVASRTNPRDRIAALDAFFTDALLNRELDPRLAAALREVFARRGDVSIAALALRSGAHTRTLTRLFDRAIGLSPKRFARIVRLQSALRALPDGASWASVAFELGYCDQAHFIREVQDLFGCTPGEARRLAGRTR
jgi:AraC-like DNA-binding protein